MLSQMRELAVQVLYRYSMCMCIAVSVNINYCIVFYDETILTAFKPAM